MKKARFVGTIEEVPAVHPAAVGEFEAELEYFERTGFADEDAEGCNIVSAFEHMLRAQG